MKAIYPYLSFNGNTEEAIRFYQSIFGGELLLLSRFKDMPGNEKLSQADLEKVMHVTLKTKEGIIIMASDVIESMSPPLKKGNNYSLSIEVESKEEADRIFDGLKTNGEVIMPLDNMFWGSYFGLLFDQFGIQWMISFSEEKQ
ncbi:MAG: VOC family protein [Spirochaetes bacterium]|nr:VOC family protein [Spirochaetota bacterium]